MSEATIRYLDHHGHPTGALPHPLERTLLLNLYRSLQLTRTFDTQAVLLQRMGKLSTFPSSYGQEAVFCGAAHALAPEDIYCPYYRDQGALLVRGVPPQQLLQYWQGDERGSLWPTHDLPICVPIATQCTHAAGVAYALKMKGSTAMVCCSLGEGATSKGDFYEAMNFASLYALPLIFHINNNGWAISTPVAKQSAASMVDKASACALKAYQVDGTDILAVYFTVKEAKARREPCLIESRCQRLGDHTTADDANRYRAPFEDTSLYDPLHRFRHYLRRQDITADELANIDADCHDTIAAAITELHNIPPAALTDLYRYLRAEQ
jgi:2-oxoisovalerate dehydrogenase E1 component alpha subunit